MKKRYFCVLCFVGICIGSGMVQINPENCLRKLGFLKETTGSEKLSHETLRTAILKFQHFNNLTVTGQLDGHTLNQMIYPKSSAPEIRKKRRRTWDKWPHNKISWKISKYSRNSALTRAQQRATLRRAIEIWSSVTPLQFEETIGKANITISFEVGYHGCGFPFDGKRKKKRSNTLAHTFHPPKGIIHIDDDEYWVLGNKSKGKNLLTLAAHEVGHALGLYHIPAKRSIMTTYYSDFPDTLKLSPEDIAAIQAKYGSLNE